MAEKQFLKLMLAGQSFLLAAAASYSIENRNRLLPPQGADKKILAWHYVQQQRWPVLALDTADIPFSGTWSQVVFIKSQNHPVGLACEQLNILPQEAQLDIRPITGVGSRVPGGSLFSAVSLHGPEPIFVFSVQRLLQYLQQRLV